MYNAPELVGPYVNIFKTDIVKRGIELRVPFEKTWSCYEGNERPCSKCGTCQERIEAFAKNNVRDPLYSEEEWIEVLNSK
jgi:7-cyano-7-deazaguanine synthase